MGGDLRAHHAGAEHGDLANLESTHGRVEQLLDLAADHPATLGDAHQGLGLLGLVIDGLPKARRHHLRLRAERHQTQYRSSNQRLHGISCKWGG
jgi:hypothetical protein